MNKFKKRTRLLGFIMVFLSIVFIYAYLSTMQVYPSNRTLADLYIQNTAAETSASNIVTGIYLDYRIFDTILETLLLLVSITAVFQFIKLESFEKRPVELETHEYLHEPSSIQRYTLSIIFPIFIILGIYEVLYGTVSPGGGFQGGAILAAVIMCRFLIVPHERYNYDLTFIFEKIIYLLIIIIVTVHFLDIPIFNDKEDYLLILNILLGAKVAFGITTLFLRFIYFEEGV